MWTYGFFNSVNNDRLYNADTMSSIFEGLITDGVYESVGNKLAVQPNSGMTVQIATGRGWFGKRWVNNDSAHLLTLDASDVTLNRYAAICIRVNTNDDTRSAVPYIKYSSFATNPTKPAMTRSEAIKEYCLAYILIKAGATSINEADIEDTRSDTSLCGWVTGLIDQLDTRTLYTQFTAMFNEWFNALQNDANASYAEFNDTFNDWFAGLQDNVNENTETMLVNAMPTSTTITLTASAWTSNGSSFTQTVTVPNMNATKSVMVQGSTSTLEAYSSAGITCTSQNTNTLTFTATSKPTTSIYVDVVHMGV